MSDFNFSDQTARELRATHTCFSAKLFAGSAKNEHVRMIWDVESAYLEAHRAALEIAFEMLRDRRDPTRHQFDIVDNGGRLLMDVPFAEVMNPRARTYPQGALFSQVRASLHRNRVLQHEIRSEFTHARTILENARATVRKARARG